jgi:hypothetical protein
MLRLPSNCEQFGECVDVALGQFYYGAEPVLAKHNGTELSERDQLTLGVMSILFGIRLVNGWCLSRLDAREHRAVIDGVYAHMRDVFNEDTDRLRHAEHERARRRRRELNTYRMDPRERRDPMCWEVADAVSREFAPRSPELMQPLSVIAEAAGATLYAMCDELTQATEFEEWEGDPDLEGWHAVHTRTRGRAYGTEIGDCIQRVLMTDPLFRGFTDPRAPFLVRVSFACDELEPEFPEAEEDFWVHVAGVAGKPNHWVGYPDDWGFPPMGVDGHKPVVFEVSRAGLRGVSNYSGAIRETPAGVEFLSGRSVYW